ncbi:hypothetical protein, partial [Acetobacter cibinongensis]|uniref:hypothetical protein n=1 Tax=Acetobacter cibinongensis TaxID=146475 RepID=UPI0038CF5D53
GVANSTLVNSGASISANGGTLAGNTKVNSGGVVSATSSTALSGTVDVFGKVSGGTVVTSASVNVWSGGLVSGIAISNGTIALNDGAVGSNINVISGAGTYGGLHWTCHGLVPDLGLSVKRR